MSAGTKVEKARTRAEHTAGDVAESEKLHKVLARAGLGSRREVRALDCRGASERRWPAGVDRGPGRGQGTYPGRRQTGAPLRGGRGVACAALPQGGGRGVHPPRPGGQAHRVSSICPGSRVRAGSRSGVSTSVPPDSCSSPTTASSPGASCIPLARSRASTRSECGRGSRPKSGGACFGGCAWKMGSPDSTRSSMPAEAARIAGSRWC